MATTGTFLKHTCIATCLRVSMINVYMYHLQAPEEIDTDTEIEYEEDELETRSRSKSAIYFDVWYCMVGCMRIYSRNIFIYMYI